MLAPSIDTVRLFLHVVAASVWVGGQVVMAGLVPALRGLGPDVSKTAANGFARVAWPAFGLAFITGTWNMFEVPPSASVSYHMTLGIKILLVVAAGASAAVHSRTPDKAVLAATGAIGMLASLVALFFGVLLAG
ncbi:MAG: hypothetical protein O3C27_04480 [Actinomycetota bacterium]|nr:hypothetical protein [Actinomycetota bacterium]